MIKSFPCITVLRLVMGIFISVQKITERKSKEQNNSIYWDNTKIQTVDIHNSTI